jgi:signal peptidase I
VTTLTNDITTRPESTPRTRRFHTRGRVANVIAAATLAVALAVVVLVVTGMLLGAWRIVPVRSGSMTPVAPKGSAVIAQPMQTSKLRVGDVVLFRAPVGSHPLVVHRIHEIVVHNGERLYRTKGDANAAPDPWLIRVPSTTVWRVRHVIPVVGTAVDEMSKPVPRFAGIVLASLVILGIGLGRIWRREESKSETQGHAATSGEAETTGERVEVATAAVAAQAATAANAATASAAAAARSVDGATDDGADEILHTA